ncbi:uncharacterized protein LOC135806231 [Sycon ciliatum]|uniref:uncharacterized protein LOC135806231 n=1 Tax=Sycon ciliatum TaxID=27933 RepID=UPI0020ACB04B|eukprot:scpid82792/ scgid30732/ 
MSQNKTTVSSTPKSCPECGSILRYCRMSTDDALYLCSKESCAYPLLSPSLSALFVKIPDSQKLQVTTKRKAAACSSSASSSLSCSPASAMGSNVGQRSPSPYSAAAPAEKQRRQSAPPSWSRTSLPSFKKTPPSTSSTPSPLSLASSLGSRTSSPCTPKFMDQDSVPTPEDKQWQPNAD